MALPVALTLLLRLANPLGVWAAEPLRYPAARTAMEAGGADNVYLIWTTPAATLDQLALECIGSVVSLYQEHVFLFANNLTVADLENVSWGKANLVHYDPTDVLQGTPLASWFTEKREELSRGKFYFSHLTDMLRIALVYTYGGAYFDADVLALRRLNPHHINRLVRYRNDSDFFETAVIYFSPGHPFLFAAMKLITRSYNPDNWISAGPGALTDTYNAIAGNQYIRRPGQVYPGVWLGLRLSKARAFWEEGVLQHSDFIGCEAIHLWGSVVRGYLRSVSTDSEFGYLNSPEQRRRVTERIATLRNLTVCVDYISELRRSSRHVDRRRQLRQLL
ncbi:hypothetical protein GPECTOR_1g134 [Gonium pectorale]|uniref:Alpha 1,4-glycosyltransferase domain-containing protein n=1 Tax=Gonium pectorale TaxID=33097 RepID=A0A150H1Y1_GONPE|nr:hypothetical protein GPECTOR_1g134 [Gonium pectorale]|eukprot:KXZ56157.1 hypothetical protein GPECTOR_1g134 [Gonium pectorale]